jgi:outer membrane protein insertion porin family
MTRTIQQFFSLCFLFLMIGTPLLLSQESANSKARLHQIKIIGNAHVAESEIQNWLNLRRGQEVSQPLIHARAQNLLLRFREAGYYFAGIDSVRFHYSYDSSRVEAAIYLQEGARLKIGQVQLLGWSDGDNLKNELRTRPGRNFQHHTLEEDIDAILRYFEERGFPYCRVNVEQLEFRRLDEADEMAVDITLKIIPGPSVAIGEIEIRGNELTKARVIQREAGIRIGELYQQRRIDKIAPQLLRLGYFKWVNPPKLEWLPDSTGRLIIELAEGSSNRFDGVLGYNPPVGNSRGFVTGLIDISFRNLFGTGRQIDARWERRTARTQQLRFRYLEPWVAGLPLNAALRFEQLIQDTIFVQREIGLQTSYRINENVSLLAGVSRRDVSPDSLGQAVFGIPASHSINFAVGLNLNTLDYPRNPQKGIHYDTTFEWSRKSIADAVAERDNSFNQRRIALDFATYISPFRWQVFAFGLHGRQITSGEDLISITDHFRLGGARSLRGYREEQFRGDRIAWANFEYRYLLNRESRFFVFLDAGYFHRQELVAESLLTFEDVQIGYGLGLRLDTRLGFFGIDYGLGEGDGLSNGKVHFSLTNEF